MKADFKSIHFKKILNENRIPLTVILCIKVHSSRHPYITRHVTVSHVIFKFLLTWLLVKTFPHCHRPLSAEVNEAWTAYRVPAWTRQGVQKVMKKSPGALHTNRAAFRSIIPLELHAPRLRALTL